MARYSARDPEAAKKMAMARMKQQAQVCFDITNFLHLGTG